MAIEAYFIGGPNENTPGPAHSPENVRGALYDSTSGAEGVSSVDGLKVRAQATPNNTVRVLPGGALLNNRYPGGDGQSYRARYAAQESVEVTATGSGGGRTDFVILRIVDPQYEGQPPTDVDAFEYRRIDVIEDVPESITTGRDLNLQYPYIPLAKITLPKSTGTVEQKHITDLRRVANPLSDRVTRTNPRYADDAGPVLNTHSESGEWFPNSTYQDIDIPEWATRMDIIPDWLSVRYAGGKNPNGEYWIEWGPKTAPSDREMSTQRYRFDSPGQSNNVSRFNWRAADNVYIPKRFRGTTQRFVFKARYTSTDEGVSMDGTSGTILQIVFEQVADPSSS